MQTVKITLGFWDYARKFWDILYENCDTWCTKLTSFTEAFVMSVEHRWKHNWQRKTAILRYTTAPVPCFVYHKCDVDDPWVARKSPWWDMGD